MPCPSSNIVCAHMLPDMSQRKYLPFVSACRMVPAQIIAVCMPMQHSLFFAPLANPVWHFLRHVLRCYRPWCYVTDGTWRVPTRIASVAQLWLLERLRRALQTYIAFQLQPVERTFATHKFFRPVAFKHSNVEFTCCLFCLFGGAQFACERFLLPRDVDTKPSRVAIEACRLPQGIVHFQESKGFCVKLGKSSRLAAYVTCKHRVSGQCELMFK